MSDAKLIGKLLRVPRLVWERRFDSVARVLAAERLVRIAGVIRVYRVARWIGFRRLARWALAHRVPEVETPEAEKPKAEKRNVEAPARRSRKAA
ncbi:MAG: hypothetical protein ACAI25_06320 [Planctomycetota bacterium]